MTKRKRGRSTREFLETYRRIRKPMPPPEKVIRDRRREISDEVVRREIEEGEARDRSADG
jgi:hypothetical protein